MNKKTVYKIAASSLLAVSIGIGGFFAYKEQLAATVNGETITKSELIETLMETDNGLLLENLIQIKAVLAEAEKQNVKVSESEINDELKLFNENFESKEAFEQFVNNYYQMSVDKFNEQIKINLLIEKMISKEFTINEDDVKDFYENNKDMFVQQEEVKARHILVESKDQADEIIEKLNQGEKFEELAKESSIDTKSAATGGDLGFFPKGTMLKEFEDVAFSLKIDEISEPVKSEFGFHIIQVTDKKEAKESTFEENKELAKKYYTDQKVQENLNAWLTEVIEKQEIKRYL